MTATQEAIAETLVVASRERLHLFAKLTRALHDAEAARDADDDYTRDVSLSRAIEKIGYVLAALNDQEPQP